LNLSLTLSLDKARVSEVAGSSYAKDLLVNERGPGSVRPRSIVVRRQR
jgi:hypothetical protein